jgi:hypothetical protein
VNKIKGIINNVLTEYSRHIVAALLECTEFIVIQVRWCDIRDYLLENTYLQESKTVLNINTKDEWDPFIEKRRED